MRRQRPIEPTTVDRCAQEARLVAAENRANVLFEKAEWLQTMVKRRDQDNHWQQSVNQLFLGGKTT